MFFKADIVSIKETLESAPTAGDALFSHGGENLLEGQIRLFGNQSQDPVRVLFQWRNTPAARFRRRAPCLTPALAPSNYRTNAHLEDLGYLPPRRSAFNRFNRTLTQVRGIRPRHRFSSPANQFPQIRLDDSGWESLRFNADGKCSSVTNLDAYVKEYAPIAQAGIKNSGGKLLAAGQAVTYIEGAPPTTRDAIQQWESLEKLQAWRNSAEFKKAREVGDKYAKFRTFVVEGLPQ